MARTIKNKKSKGKKIMMPQRELFQHSFFQQGKKGDIKEGTTKS